MGRVERMDIIDLRTIFPQASLARRHLSKLDQTFVDAVEFCAVHAKKDAVYLGSLQFDETDVMAGDHIGWLRTNAFQFEDKPKLSHAIGGLGEWIVLSRLKALKTVMPVSLVSREAVTEPDLVMKRFFPPPWPDSIVVDIKTSAGANGPGASYHIDGNSTKGLPHFLIVGIARDHAKDVWADLYFVNATHLISRTERNALLEPGEHIEKTNITLPDLLRDNTKEPQQIRSYVPNLSSPREWPAQKVSATNVGWSKMPRVDAVHASTPAQRVDCQKPGWIQRPELKKILDAEKASQGRCNAIYLFSLPCHDNDIEAGHRIAWLWEHIAGTASKPKPYKVELAIAKWKILRQAPSKLPEDLQADPGNTITVKHASIVSMGKIDEPDLTILDGSNAPVCLEIVNLQPGGRLELPQSGVSDSKKNAHVLAVDCRRQQDDEIFMDVYFVSRAAFGANFFGARLHMNTSLP
jgi:hypothetical protein